MIRQFSTANWRYASPAGGCILRQVIGLNDNLRSLCNQLDKYSNHIKKNELIDYMVFPLETNDSIINCISIMPLNRREEDEVWIF